MLSMKFKIYMENVKEIQKDGVLVFPKTNINCTTLCTR